MPYSFPSDLARVVTERWTTYVQRGGVAPPMLPEMDKLKELFEAIFFASLEREEGRLLQFTVCYSETYLVLREDGGSRINVVPFLNPRALSAKDLNWNTCLEPVLRAIFPLAEREQKVRDDCKELFQYLHRYAHPSAYLLDRMTDDSALHVKDGFDENWATQTVEIGARVFDLAWMVVFAHHPDAFDRVEPLSGSYPVVSAVFDSEKRPEQTQESVR